MAPRQVEMPETTLIASGPPIVLALVRSIPPVAPDATCGDVHQLLESNPDWPAIAAVADGRAVGIVARSAFDLPFVRDALNEGLKVAPVRQLMTEPVVVAHDTPLSAVAERAISAGLFVITEEGAYLGVGTSADLHRALSEASERLVDLADASPVWFWERNEEGRYTYVSPRIESMTGIPAEKFLGLTPIEVQSLGIKVEGVEHLTEAMMKREPYRDLPLRLTLPSGRVIDWLSTAKPIYRPDGTFAGYRGTSADMTEAVPRDAEVARQREGLRRFSTYVPGVVFQMKIDAGGEYSFPFISDRVQDIYGVTPAEVYANSRARFEFVHPDDMARLREAIAESRERLTPWSCAYRVCRDGRTIWMHGNARPERQPDGSTIWDGVSIDITPLKEHEGHLRDALAAAESANVAKRDFLATVTHELRTPLNAIIGFAEVLKCEAFGPIGSADYVVCANDISASGRLLLSLINDILDFARLEAAGVVLTEEEVELEGLLGASLGKAASKAEERGISLGMASWSEPVLARIDRPRVLQILDNLVSNAVKFTPSGGTVLVGTAVDATGSIELTVSDTGSGIPGEDLPHVFEPFWQAGGSRSRARQEGTGLGLPLAKRLTELHGGRISIESRPGRGTTVRLTFPRERLVEGSAVTA